MSSVFIIAAQSATGLRTRILTLIILLASQCVIAQFNRAHSIYHDFNSFIEKVNTADFDNDGDIDVITKAESIVWLHNDGTGKFSDPISLPASSFIGIISIIPFDFDNDGDQDVVSGNGEAGTVMLWTSNATGVFSNPITISDGVEAINSLTVADIDNDGDLDVAVATPYAQSHWLENKYPSATWEAHAMPNSHVHYFHYADVNGDGTIDACAINLDGSVSVNNVKVKSDFSSRSAKFIGTSDINRDGATDLVVAVKGYDEGLVWFENKNGSFEEHLIPQSENRDYRSTLLIDYDDDGDDDVLAACWFDCGTELFENIGGGRFNTPVNVGGGGVQEEELVAADFNADGKIDFAKTNASFGSVLWIENVADKFSGIQADFYSEGTCAGADVFFQQAARGKNIENWTWNFGDGVESNERNPVHKYAQTGTYSVTLTVKNVSGESSSYAQQLSITALPKLEDKVYRFCTNSLSISLDPAHTYKWYLSQQDEQYYLTGPNATLFDNTTYYVTRTDSKGCVSEKTKLVGEKLDYPDPPATTDATSQDGSAELLLKGMSAAGDVVFWTNAAGDTLSSGPYYVGTFHETTTLFASSVNSAHCSSQRVPVTAYVFDKPSLAPVFTWADGTQSNSWSEAIDMALDHDGNYLAYGLWSKNDFKAGDYLIPGNGQAHRVLIVYTESGEVLGATKVLGDAALFYANEKIAVDSENNVYVSFSFEKPFLFLDKLIDGGYSNKQYPSWGFIGKFTADGQYLWHIIQDEGIQKLMIMEDDNLFLANSGGQLAKRSKVDGTILWSQNTGYEFDDVTFDKSGFFYFALSPDSNPNGMSDARLIKYDPELPGAVWVKELVENEYRSELYKVVIDHEGNVVVHGGFSINRWQDPSRQDVSLLGEIVGGGHGSFVAKLTPEGVPVWGRRINHIQYYDVELKVDELGNIFSSGLGSSQVSLQKFGSDGELQWQRQFNGPRFVSIEPDQKGNAMVYGYFVDQIELDGILLRSATHESFVNYNMFIAKLGTVAGANFMTRNTCLGSKTSFVDLSTASEGSEIVSWSWDFGGGMTSTAKNPEVQFTSPGSHLITLSTTDSNGAIAQRTQIIQIYSPAAKPQIIREAEAICEGAPIQLRVNGSHDVYMWSTGEMTSSIQSSEVSSLTVKVANADQLCWSPLSDEVTIEVMERPDAPEIDADATSVCEYENIHLSAPNHYTTYSWSNGENTSEINVNTPGQYWLQVGHSSNCLSEKSFINLSFKEAPEAFIIVEDGILKASEGLSYQWFRNEELTGVTEKTFPATEAGKYVVKVTNELGCSSLSPPVIVTGIEDSDLSVRVWPNPTESTINLQSEHLISNVVVTTVSGIPVATLGNVTEIDLSKMPAAVYLLTIHFHDKQVRRLKVFKR
jgi:PKD repeat protein